MMKKIDIIIVGVLTVLIMMSAVSVTSTPRNAEGRISAKDTETIYVGGSGLGNYSTIQDGIDDANESDTVYVYSGTYSENIVINETISLIGEDRDTTVIDGVEGIREVVYVEANWVNISGFTLKSKQRGILLDSVSNNSITNCTLSDNEYGIYAQGSSKNKITNCNISDNSNYGIQFELSSNNNSIYHNNFIGNTNHAYDSCSNYWDNEYPSGGNYWGGWIGIADTNHGENQSIPGSDGIYDGPFNILGYSNQDRYPLAHFFILDEITPEINLNFPENNSVIKPGTIIDFGISDENLNIVRCSVNEEEYEPFLLPYNLTADWDDGTHNITIYANDYGRNERDEFFTFTVDGVEPDISLISPENNSLIKPGTIIDFEINDTHLNLTTYTLNDGLPITLSSPYNISTEGWDDGAYNITVWADDLAGNEKTENFTFIIDGTAPYINITGVANGSYYNTNVIIFVNISDAHLNATENNITLDNTSFISGAIVSSEGKHILYVYAVDKAGNNMSQTIIFTIDKTKPVLEILSPTNNTVTNQNITLVYFVSDNFDDIGNITVIGPDNNTVYSNEGEYTVTIYAFDRADNNATQTTIFTIDKTPPTIKISEKNQTTTGSSFTIHWYSSEPIRYYEVSVDGEKWINISINTYCTFTLSKGVNTFYVKGKDLAGNTNTTTVTIERTEEKEEGMPDYLIYLITIPFVFVVVLVVIIAFLKRKIRIRCPACKAVFDVRLGKRPLKTECPKCGREGVLR